jgi:hypothetical protein
MFPNYVLFGCASLIIANEFYSKSVQAIKVDGFISSMIEVNNKLVVCGDDGGAIHFLSTETLSIYKKFYPCDSVIYKIIKTSNKKNEYVMASSQEIRFVKILEEELELIAGRSYK